MKKGLQLEELFAEAQAGQEVIQLEAKVDSLTREIERLRQQGVQEIEEVKLTELRSHLQAEKGTNKVRLDQISRNLEQPRKSFSPESLKLMAQSLLDNGQQEPIIVTSKNLIFDGERRYRAAIQLGWDTLEAVIIPEPEELHKRVLIANLHREELNYLDIGEALIDEIRSTSGLEKEAIVRGLSSAMRRINRNKQLTVLSELVSADSKAQQEGVTSLGLSEAQELIIQTILSLRLHPRSVECGPFRAVELPNDLKTAIREQGLGNNHALAIAKLNAKALGTEKRAKAIRAKVTQKVLQEQLPLTITKQLVSSYFSSKPDTKSQITPVLQSLLDIKVEELEPEDREELIKTLTSKLKQLGV
jgi:ParB family chromosome partitioning protein